MIYVVSITYKDFVFTDKLEALKFAETAFLNSKSPESVSVKFEAETEAEDE